MEIRRQEEQLDWVEQTQRGQSASFVAAHIFDKTAVEPAKPKFVPRTLAREVNQTRVGKTRVPNLLVPTTKEDLL